MAMKVYQLNGEIADFDYHDNIWDFCGPKSLKAFLASLSAGEKAVIEINSPGGYVMSGVEMANAIKNSKAHLIAHVTGMAASMASVIACACDEIEMEEASFMMIHDPWSYIAGNAADMRKEAGLLDQCKKVSMSFYLGKFARSEEELSALMSEETWFTGKECLENGLKCTVIPAAENRLAAKITENGFAKMPEAAAKFVKASVEMNEETKAKIAAIREKALAADKAEEEESFKARYQGASKKINEYQAKIVDLEKDAAAKDEAMASVQKKLDEAVAKIAALEKAAADTQDLSGKIEKAEKDLADAVAAKDAALEEVSGLKAKLEKSEKDLAECRERAEKLEKTRDLLTGGVLSVSEGETYAAKMAAAKTPEEREALRAQKAAGKIK